MGHVDPARLTTPPVTLASTGLPVPWWVWRTTGLILTVLVAAGTWAFGWSIAIAATRAPSLVAHSVSGTAWTDVPSQVSRRETAGDTQVTRPEPAHRGDRSRATRTTRQPEDPPSTEARPGSGFARVGGDQRRRRTLVARARRSDRSLTAFVQSLGAFEGPWVRPIIAPYRITAEFGSRGSLWASIHTGIDLAAPSGTPVRAVAPGTVTAAGEAGAYGLKVEIKHEDGTETWYAHMSRIDASVGQVVKAGTLVGAVGATGNVTGPHLHFEVRPDGGVPVDPARAMRARGVEL